jgi:hypothetical protein
LFHRLHVLAGADDDLARGAVLGDFGVRVRPLEDKVREQVALGDAAQRAGLRDPGDGDPQIQVRDLGLADELRENGILETLPPLLDIGLFLRHLGLDRSAPLVLDWDFRLRVVRADFAGGHGQNQADREKSIPRHFRPSRRDHERADSGQSRICGERCRRCRSY